MDRPALHQKLEIRHVTNQDLPALEWGGEYIHFRRLFAQAFQRAQQGEAVLWVAELPEAGIIGQLFVQLKNHRNDLANGGSRGYIYAFRVRSQYREQGVGTRLLQTAESDLLSRGCHRVALNVSRDNLRALQLYENLGYYIVATEPGIWS